MERLTHSRAADINIFTEVLRFLMRNSSFSLCLIIVDAMSKKKKKKLEA